MAGSARRRQQAREEHRASSADLAAAFQELAHRGVLLCELVQAPEVRVLDLWAERAEVPILGSVYWCFERYLGLSECF